MLELQNLVKQFGDIRAVDGVSLKIEAGETLGLVGESGSGKTTLGRCALLLEEPTSGEIVFEGRRLRGLSRGDLRRMRRHMQIVFQDPYASLNPRMTIGRILAEPFDIHESLSDAETRDRVSQLLDAVGLTAEAGARYPHEFSGGQRQRIGIARALALRPKLIVADEPVSALDVSVGAQIVNLLQDLQQQYGLTYLFITHGLPVVRHISTRIAVMYLGRLAELGPAEAVFTRPLHPYTKLLRNSTPSVGQVSNLPSVGQVGNLPYGRTGCLFRTRCPLATERCAAETPPLREIEPGRFAACHFAENVQS